LPESIQPIATAIDYLVNNPEISYKIANNGREFVKSLFNVDRLIEDIKRLYKEVLLQ